MRLRRESTAKLWQRPSPALSAYLASACLGLYYLLTMSRDLSLYDSGELALAAATLGLGHPPGQPLHSLLGFVVSHLGMPALWGLNALSALPAALSLIPAARIGASLARATHSGLRPTRLASVIQPWLLAAVALHESLWEPATRVEVYALASLFALWAVALALPMCSTSPQDTPTVESRVFRLGVLLGLSASANPIMALITGCALIPALLPLALARRVVLATLWRGLCGCVLGLLPYVYLPLVAAYGRAMVWGGLHDGAAYLRYLTLHDYVTNQTLSNSLWFEHAQHWSTWATQHLLAPTLILGLGGFVRARSCSVPGRLLYVITGGCLLATISHNFVWDLDVPDYNGYMSLAYWLAAAGASALFVSSLSSGRHVASAAIALCLGASVLVSPAPWERTRAHDKLARTLAERVLREAPPHAIVISYADYYAGSLFYLQQAERQRPDVVVLAYGLAASSWHWRHLATLHPELQPADLRSRSDRRQRIKRWLHANPARPVLIENLQLAQQLELDACVGGLYLRTGRACRPGAAPDAAVAQLLARQLTQLGAGSPGAAGAIAQVSEKLGENLWQLGWPAAALDTLLAGVSRRDRPRHYVDSASLAPAARVANQLQSPSPSWKRSAALGDPARNLFLAGAITLASGQPEAARPYLQAAAALDLPEATQLFEHMQ